MNNVADQLFSAYLGDTSGRSWLKQQLEKLTDGFRERDFYLAFSACARHLSQEVVDFKHEDLPEIEQAYPNFRAKSWTRDELARIILMCALPLDQNQAVLKRLLGAADYRETVVIYKGIYFLENAESYVAQAREGLRTNMVGVFDAIALDNPFPYDYLSEDAWNQMVLKAMFMERPMYRVFRIEDRKNAALAEIFLDYSEERRSAHRSVSPELWRFTSGFASGRLRKALEKTLLEGSELEQAAAQLALVETYPEEKASAELPSWDEIGEAVEKA